MFGFVLAIAFFLSALCSAAQEDDYVHDRDLVRREYVLESALAIEDEEERAKHIADWDAWFESRKERPWEIAQLLILWSDEAITEEDRIFFLSLARQCKALIDDAEIDLHVDDASSVEAGS